MSETAPSRLASLAAEADRCVACGLCLPHCPTYRKIQSEADSPRGRIQLISAVAHGKLQPSARLAQHIALCLSCRACEYVCPNRVNYGRLMDAARYVIISRPANPERLAGWLLKRRRLIAGAGRLLRFAEIARLRKLARWLPKQMRNALALLPPIPPQEVWKPCYPAPAARGEVALFLGCVSSVVDTGTLRTAIHVLNRLGISVHVSLAQCCCGAMARQAGHLEAAECMVARNRTAFAKFAKMPLVGVASGCCASLQDYLGRPVMDISAYLDTLDWSAIGLLPLPRTIFVHDPCSLRYVLRQHEAVYRLLQRIPNVEIKPLPDNPQCCGGAGTYLLMQPAMAQRLRDDKIAACQQNGAALVATSNIGCVLNLRAGLTQAGRIIEIAHPLVILARQLG